MCFAIHPSRRKPGGRSYPCASPLRNEALPWARPPRGWISAGRLGGERRRSTKVSDMYAQLFRALNVSRGPAAASARIAAPALPAGSAKMQVVWALPRTPPSSSLPLVYVVRHRDCAISARIPGSSPYTLRPHVLRVKMPRARPQVKKSALPQSCKGPLFGHFQ